ncbi:MAG: protein kinase [Polyangiales bacterium]
MLTRVEPGDVIADRFVVEAPVGHGGMGAVFRARDRLTGDLAAVKVLRDDAARHFDRFVREARVLAELRHPGVVRYVAHGAAPGGAWIAMEWLDGEDLAERLARGGLTVAETVALVGHVAAALAEVHARGVIHRDLKPRNLFLPGGDPRRVKLLDFGVARWDAAGVTLTGAGVTLGTPGYMAPEQVRGDRELTPAADVFALGCVWYECLVGRAPFHSELGVARLAKALLEDAPRVSASRPDVPDDLDDLVDWTLVKDPARRPADGAALLAAVAELALVEQGGGRASLAPRALTSAERRLFSVVMVPPPSSAAETAVTERGAGSAGDTLAAAARRFGGRVEALPQGTLVASFVGHGTATDQAARAARCALALGALAPGESVTLATGWGRDAQHATAGEVIDRAAALSLLPPAAGAGRAPVRVDDVTAGLLGEGFELARDVHGALLVGARETSPEAGRTLLGAATPFVGRDADLRALLAWWGECVGEGVSRAVLVTAPAGLGKTRLLREFVAALRREGGGATVLVGRGDMVAAGAPFGLLASALLAECGVTARDEPDAARSKVRARTSRHLAGEAGARAAAFLGELMGVRFEGGGELAAARRDPRLMGDQVRAAWESWLAAECDAAPVLLALEDLHWGDLPSVALVDGALRALREKPWMALALARPEVDAAFPALWEAREVQRVQLRELGARAGERLARSALGPDAPAERVAALVARAAGNPLYLEELVRAEAGGAGDALPGTVLAMFQARLDAMEPEARRLLRAASVFGLRFTAAGLRALLGEGDDVGAWLDALVSREVLVVVRDGSPEPAFAFRHALLRDAVYGALVDDDRALGHRLAGAWLESDGERDALRLAGHFERGRDPERAAGWYRRAAAQCLDGGDLDGALACCARGAACGARAALLGELRAVEAEAHKWRGAYARAEACAAEALALLPPDSARWFAAAGEWNHCLTLRGAHAELAALAPALTAAPADDATPCEQVVAAARLARSLLLAGRLDEAAPLRRWLADAARTSAGADPAVAATLAELHAHERGSEGDPDVCDDLDAAARGFERAGNRRVACVQRVNLGSACAALGRYDEAERALREALADAERMGLANAALGAKNNLALAVARLGRLDEALSFATDAARGYAALGDARMAGGTRIYAAEAHAAAGRHADAEREARAAAEALVSVPPLRAHALGVLSRAVLAGSADRATEALALAEEALASAEGMDEGEALVRLAHAEALAACGHHDAARRAFTDAAGRLRERAGRIADPSRRARFLQDVAENARTLALADAPD